MNVHNGTKGGSGPSTKANGEATITERTPAGRRKRGLQPGRGIGGRMCGKKTSALSGSVLGGGANVPRGYKNNPHTNNQKEWFWT